MGKSESETGGSQTKNLVNEMASEPQAGEDSEK